MRGLFTRGTGVSGRTGGQNDKFYIYVIYTVVKTEDEHTTGLELLCTIRNTKIKLSNGFRVYKVFHFTLNALIGGGQSRLKREEQQVLKKKETSRTLRLRRPVMVRAVCVIRAF